MVWHLLSIRAGRVELQKTQASWVLPALSEGTMVVNDDLEHDEVEAQLAAVGAVTVGQAGGGDIHPVQDPNALGKAQGAIRCQHLQGAMHGVPQAHPGRCCTSLA